MAVAAIMAAVAQDTAAAMAVATVAAMVVAQDTVAAMGVVAVDITGADTAVDTAHATPICPAAILT